MFFAGIPVALWKDSKSDVDTSLLNFFYMPNSLEDLCRFAINPKDQIQLNGAIRQLSEAKLSTKSNFLKLFTSLIN